MTFLEAVSAAQGGALIRPEQGTRAVGGWAYRYRYGETGWRTVTPGNREGCMACWPGPSTLAGPWECVTWEQLEEERRT